GNSQKIKFNTDPAGATLKVADKTLTTPAEVELKRKETYDVTLSKEGYRTVMFQMNSTWDGASLAGAILPGGSLMLATDRTTGADLAFYDPPTIKLEPAPADALPKQMFLRRGRLLTKEEFDKEVEEARIEAFRRRD